MVLEQVIGRFRKANEVLISETSTMTTLSDRKLYRLKACSLAERRNHARRNSKIDHDSGKVCCSNSDYKANIDWWLRQVTQVPQPSHQLDPAKSRDMRFCDSTCMMIRRIGSWSARHLSAPPNRATKKSILHLHTSIIHTQRLALRLLQQILLIFVL